MWNSTKRYVEITKLAKRYFSQSKQVKVNKLTPIHLFNKQVDKHIGVIEVQFSDGYVSKFHQTWLIDHDPSKMHPTSKQRQLDPTDILNQADDPDTFVESRVIGDGSKVAFDFVGSKVFNGSNEILTVEHDAGFLRKFAYSNNRNKGLKIDMDHLNLDEVLKPFDLWTAEKGENGFPTYEYSQVQHKKDEMLLNLYKTGAVLIKNMPQKCSDIDVDLFYFDTRYNDKPTANLKPASVEPAIVTEQFVRRYFGCPRETFYGRMWDTAPKDAGQINDTAYTKDALHVHTDGTYWVDTPGLQIFHCVAQSGTDPKEGRTRLLDGFKIMQQLYHEDRSTFDFFTKQILRFNSKEENVFMECPSPVFKLFNNEELQFRYNNYDLSAIGMDLKFKAVGEFYRRNKKLCALMRDDKNIAKIRLEIGDMIVINNHRVCHGRESFTGYRSLVGCYVGKDDWMSQVRLAKERTTSA